ncbi:HIT family protein [Nanoarchaeota archaeon]
MVECLLCQISDGKVPSKKVYEDDKIIVVLDFMGALPGHCFVLPKKHYTIIEQVPDEEIALIFEIANKVSSALFETMDVQGTNVYITNGVSAGQQVPHFFCHVIPRLENDGINLQWSTKQLSEEEMSTIELKLKEQIGDVVSYSAAPKVESKQKKPKVFSSEEGEENYMLKQLKRIP